MSRSSNQAQPGKLLLGVGDRDHIVKCNHCREVVLSSYRSLHALECRKRRNAAKLNQFNLAKDGKNLYALAIVRRKYNPREGTHWVHETHYSHGVNDKDARAQFMAGETHKRAVKILACGLAIGWFQDQETGVITG